MKAIRLHQAGDLRVHFEERPTPTDGECLVQIGAVGICGSDLQWFEQGGIGETGLSTPLVLGHEFAGWRVDDGIPVAVEPAIPCGNCETCLEGNPNLCPNVIFAGHGSVDGALREYVAWPVKNLFQLPGNLTIEEGAMLEPLGVAIYAAELAALYPGMDIGIFGCGPIGLLILQLVRFGMAKFTLATDRLEHRLQAANAFGADLAVQVEKTGLLSESVLRSRSRGLDLVFEAAGDNAAIESALQAVRPGGQVILVGIPRDDQISFHASIARRKGLKIQFVRRMKHTYPRAIGLVAQKKIDVVSLISHRFRFDQANDAFVTARDRVGLKVILTP